MDRAHDAVAHIRELQRSQQTWRAALPQLRHRFALLDLVTSCCLQHYADHDVSDDLRLLDAAVAALDADSTPGAATDREQAVRETARTLAREVQPLRDDLGDLDNLTQLTRVVADVPASLLLGRTDAEAPADLVCWNECHGLLDGTAQPYRTASRISVLAYLGAADRYRVVDPMVTLRERYENRPEERASLDQTILETATAFLAWFAGETWAGQTYHS